MDVEGSDQRGGPRGQTSRHELRDRPPGPESSTLIRVAIPRGWPEAITWRTGYRLARDEEDTVPQLLRLGGDVTAWLAPEDVAAQLVLTGPVWERWFRWGWRCWELDQEEE